MVLFVYSECEARFLMSEEEIGLELILSQQIDLNSRLFFGDTSVIDKCDQKSFVYIGFLNKNTFFCKFISFKFFCFSFFAYATRV